MLVLLLLLLLLLRLRGNRSSLVASLQLVQEHDRAAGYKRSAIHILHLNGIAAAAAATTATATAGGVVETDTASTTDRCDGVSDRSRKGTGAKGVHSLLISTFLAYYSACSVAQCQCKVMDRRLFQIL